MQTLIVYASNTGTTKECAYLLKDKLKNATLIDLSVQDVNIESYDLIIIGSSIKVGKFHKKVTEFIKKNHSLLKNKKVAYYICCGFSDNYQTYFKNNLPEGLLNTALIYETFGGIIDISKLKGLDKFIANMVSKTEDGKKEIKLLNDNIDNFIDVINKEIL